MKVARALSDALAAHGIERVFGNPGTTELPFLEGLRQEYYLTLHDALAVGAADGAAQVRRAPSVANLHAAPGLGNSIGFIDSARRNRSPVVLTVGQQDLRHETQAPLLYGDLESMVHGLVKYSHEVRGASELDDAVRHAFRHALEPPMGPVLLSLPMNVLEEEAAPYGAPDPPPDDRVDDVTHLAERIRAASAPVLVVGFEVDVFDAFAEVEALSDRLGAPVYAEPICSRAPVPGASRHFAGDLLPHSALISSLLAPHDLILLVGADLTLYPYSAAPLPRGDRMVYLGSDPSVPNKLECDRVLGDLKRLLTALLAEVPPTGRRFSRPTDFQRANRVARAAPRLGGEYVVDAIRRAFRGYSLVDESVSLIPTMKSCGFYDGRDSYFSSRSQQLGWGLAAAIGIGLERPKTVVVLGDGALQYSVQALWTLARYRVPVKVVVVNNGGYNILKSYSKANHPLLAKAAYLDLPGVDVEGLAKAYGLPAESASSAESLERALLQLRETEGPAVLNVEMDRTVPDLFS